MSSSVPDILLRKKNCDIKGTVMGWLSYPGLLSWGIILEHITVQYYTNKTGLHSFAYKYF